MNFGIQGGAGNRRSDPYGSTRTSVQTRHALLTTDGVVSAAPPGWRCAAFYTMISPALGARFCQYHVELGNGGQGRGDTGSREWVLYVLDGTVSLTANEASTRLMAGGYAYLPPATTYEISAGPEGGSLLIFEKKYQPSSVIEAPSVRFGNERNVTGTPFLGDPAAMLQVLLPDEPVFDLAVNIFKYAPGATLPFVETHVMEHGLLMLAGEGIYRLEDRWYPVRAGDAIWMAPYCPQWFVATGKAPASYIYYKDVNRWPDLGPGEGAA